MLASHKKRVMVIVAAMVMMISGFVLGTTVMSASAQQTAPVVDTPVTDTERIFSSIYNQVSPSVVSINVKGATADGQQFGATGTGFVIDTEGHIVTNDHVVADSNQIEINFLDGTIAKGTIVGLDPDSDLAVVKVDTSGLNLTPITWGDSDALFIGETTLAIGSPFGQRWTLTSGIVSALDRTISGQNQYSVGSAIQTDTAINPGNSGGPLLNLQGEVVGVNSQMLSDSNSSSGIGFAIPSNLVKRVAGELIQNGRVEYSYLGISAASGLSLALIESLNIPNNTQGVVVADVSQNGPAAQAGLKSAVGTDGQSIPTNADIITAIDGTAIADMSGLVSYLANNTKPGQTVSLSVLRDGEQITIPVTLSARPGTN